MSTRLESIKKIVELQPHDPFARYGLAMEYKSLGRLEEAAAAFVDLEARAPDYVAQYLMHFNVLVALKRKAEARDLAERGLAACRKKGDAHAQSELQAALEALDDSEY